MPYMMWARGVHTKRRASSNPAINQVIRPSATKLGDVLGPKQEMRRHPKMSRRKARLLTAVMVVFALLECAIHVHAVKTCADCPKPQLCLAETQVQLNGGNQQVTLQVCNYDANTFKSSVQSIKFTLQTVPTCDAKQQTVPVFGEFKPPIGDLGDCATSAMGCAVQAMLKTPIDWAVALKSDNGQGNALSARLVGDSLPADSPSVVVGVLASGSITGVQDAKQQTVSICSMDFPINGSSFSFVKECNKVNLCRGPAGSTTCPTPVDPSAFIDKVTCAKDLCSGTVVLAKRLACDALKPPGSNYIGQVQVANSQYSGFATLGAITAPETTLDPVVSGFTSGSRAISFHLVSVCDAPDVKMTLATSNPVSPVEIKSLDVHSDTSLTASLAQPLTDAMLQKPLQLQLTQCGQPSNVYSLSTKNAIKSGPKVVVAQENANPPANSSNNAIPPSKESSPWTGLKSGMIAGIAIGVIALVGFIVEFVYHKRHYLPPRMSTLHTRSSNPPTTSGAPYRS